ncbi:hypothetical protein [Planktotalea sp.]|uniref:hypothetical protein n=1 Tax=Planktotalea sp. TaxID=2029877 RepID=UPI003299ADAB
MSDPMRPRIFVQFLDKPFIEPTRGDMINELRFYKALMTFADVYYNDHLLHPDGTFEIRPDKLYAPSRDYDLYYVRANAELFKSLPHPKVTMALPYNEEMFAIADALIVTTQAWKDLLGSNGASDPDHAFLQKWYPKGFKTSSKIVNIRQSIDALFLKEISPQDRFEARAMTTGAGVFGFFGRVTDETIPQTLMRAIQTAKSRAKDTSPLLSAFAGNIRIALPKDSLNLGTVPYEKMPALLSGCLATLGQECADSSYLGSGKILDSMAVGTPIVSRRNLVREEQLGADYPGLFDTQEEANEIIWKLCDGSDFSTELSNYLLERRNMFTPTSNGAFIRQALEQAHMLPARQPS